MSGKISYSSHWSDVANGYHYKKSDPASFDVEVINNAYAATLVSSRGSSFSVPRIINTNAQESIIKFKYEPDLHLLANCEKLSDEQLLHLSKILLTIHGCSIHEEDRVAIDSTIDGPHKSFLHGDFGHSNIATGADGNIYIMDWCLSHCYGAPGNYGTRFFDIFIFCSFRMFNPSLRFGINPCSYFRISDRFIELYFSACTLTTMSLSEFYHYYRKNLLSGYPYKRKKTLRNTLLSIFSRSLCICYAGMITYKLLVLDGLPIFSSLRWKKN